MAWSDALYPYAGLGLRREDCHGSGGKCHGLSRVVSRVALQKRPVFIGLSRCHGSGPLGSLNAEPGVRRSECGMGKRNVM